METTDKEIVGGKKKLVVEAKAYVTRLFQDKLPSKYVYHNLEHTIDTVEAADKIASYYKMPEEEKEHLLLAAWFHDTGYIITYKGHEEESVKIAESFLKECDYPKERIDKVKELIHSTKHEHEPKDLSEKILYDADNIHVGRKRFFRRGELLRTEFEHFLDLRYSKKQWEKIQLDFLMNTAFHTSYAAKKYGKRRMKNIVKQRKTKTKAQQKKLGRGIETMYRSAYRNHIGLSSIADAKANMMISINTILLSIIVTLTSTGFTFFADTSLQHVRYTLPLIILLLGSSISLVFAVLSARPKITKKNVDKEKLLSRESSVLFFGNFVSLEREDFVKKLGTFRKNENMLYDNMSVDLYYLGMVLQNKYKLIRTSYNVFMGSLVFCVLSFIIIFVFSSF